MRYDISKSLFLLVIILFYSCSGLDSDNVTTTVESKPISDTIYGKLVHIEPTLLHVRDFAILDDRYLVIVEDRDENIFSVFQLPDMEFLYSWGRKGRGPGEYPSTVASQAIVSASNQIIVLHDPQLFSLRHYKVTDSTMVFLKQETIRYTEQRGPLNYLTKLNDSTYIAGYGMISDEEEEMEFVAIEPDNTTLLYTAGEYPQSPLIGLERFSEFGKSIVARPDGSGFAAFYFRYQYFRIYDEYGHLLKEVHINDPYLTDLPNQVGYRSFAKATDEYIFMRGPSPSIEVLQGDPSDLPSMTMEIWNWDGEPIKKIILDRYIGSLFDISNDHEKLYAFVFSYEDSFLYEFDLSVDLL